MSGSICHTYGYPALFLGCGALSLLAFGVIALFVKSPALAPAVVSRPEAAAADTGA